jgi:hypothetical protein
MSIDLAKSKDWSEITKNYVQVLAIIIAGIWTYVIFFKKDAPSLESIVNLSSNLRKQNTLNANVNEFTFDVTFKNNGISAIDIRKVRISVWKFNLDIKSISALTYIDMEQIQEDGNRIFEKEYPGKHTDRSADMIYPFLGHFSPQEPYHHAYQWFIPKGADDESVCFKIELYKDFSDKKPAWQALSWEKLN